MNVEKDIIVPDIGDFDQIEVIEILVQAGSKVQTGETLITLESDKATMELPSPTTGIIKDFIIKVGDYVKTGDKIGEITTKKISGKKNEVTKAPKEAKNEAPTTVEKQPSEKDNSSKLTKPTSNSSTKLKATLVYASPSIRKFARELGADLTKVKGSGHKSRILKEDVTQWVKSQLTTKSAAPQTGIPPIPIIDFSKFGETEIVTLSRIKRISGLHLQRAWLNIPHVTHHDEGNATQLEEFRQTLKDEASKSGVRITILVFLLKILVSTLRQFPHFNASLHHESNQLVLKKFFNIGVAMDTPNGLVVPVIRNVDQKRVFQLAKELSEVSERARADKLVPEELQGGCMTISSLGGIGGTAFTPIVNAPEVAILGVAKASMKPVWDGKKFQPQLMLPLALSYDHRVIDGADAARFMRHFIESLQDMRRTML